MGLIGTHQDFGKFPYAGPTYGVSGYAVLTTTADVEVIASQGAGTRIYITSLIVSNTSASPVRVDIKDGATVIFSVLLGAGGGGFSHKLPFPHQLLDNSPLVATISGAVTDVRVSANGFYLGGN